MARPIFSGHESFACKSHWLKRGYDFVRGENNFNDDDAVVRLGVGKNMVASIKFWLKAIGLLKDTGLVDISDHLFDDENGKDPYLEDVGTLWLLHFLLIHTDYATIYKTTFVDYHRQRNIVEKSKLQNYIKHACFEETGYKNLYNDNTVKRDIGVEDIVDSPDFKDCKLKYKGIWYNYNGNSITDSLNKNFVTDNRAKLSSITSDIKNTPLYAVRRQAVLHAMGHFRAPANIRDIARAISRTAWRSVIRENEVEEIVKTLPEMEYINGKYILRKNL